MINRAALKYAARQNMSGRKPSIFIVASVYIILFTLLGFLIYTLSGYGSFVKQAEIIMQVSPYPSYEEVSAIMPSIPMAAVVLILAMLLLRLVLGVGFKSYCLKVSRNEEASTMAIFDSFGLFTKIIRLRLLQILFIALWSCLFIVPGIVAYYRYRQAFYILLDNPDSSPLECLRQSKSMMAGYKLELFFLDFSFLGWAVMDLIVRLYATLPVLSVWLAPFAGVTRAVFYNLLVSGDELTGDEATDESI